MNVLADLHHFDLFYSFYLLFEKRLGYKLYRPIGESWLDEGYWSISHVPMIQKGYLVGSIEKELRGFGSFEGYPEWARHALDLLRVGNTYKINDKKYKVFDKSKSQFQRAITLEGFKETKFDYIISSVPQHFDLFEKLRKAYQPSAKHIFQAGNVWPIPRGCQNLMYSTLPNETRNDINKVRYHQEFNLEDFPYVENPDNNIYSYVHFPEGEKLWNSVSPFLSFPFCFKWIGKTLGLVEDIIIKTSDLGKHIGNSFFTWHIKPGGEGYGHILYNSFACGTPLVTSISDYKNMCGAELLVDGITCIDVDNKLPEQIASEMTEMIKDRNKRTKIRQNVYNKFRSCVNFNKEFESIRLFLKECK